MENENDKFYTDASQYWSKIPATVEGMLGGFGFISQTDIKGSKTFLQQLFKSKCPPGKHYALDCGAGIGRISKFLLTSIFDQVDLVEQNPLFLEQVENYMGPKQFAKINKMYAEGLQHFTPESGKYDVIWIQWVVGHLKDDHFVRFLNACKLALNSNGVIIMKENITSSEELEVDENDSSVTRPFSAYKTLFSLSGLDCIKQSPQLHFPKALYKVYMFALRPSLQTKVFENIASDHVE